MQPEYGNKKFKCPHCQTVATQRWYSLGSASEVANNILNHIYMDYRTGIQDYYQTEIQSFLKAVERDFKRNFSRFCPNGFAIATCSSCDEFAIWVNKEMKYPRTLSIAAPNDDLSDDIKNIYHEASSILTDSPKGATALLRLALQMLMVQVGKKGKNINSDIKELVSEGLSQKIQQALDLLRVVGNNAVHPGQINLDDSPEIAHNLFGILNFIAEELITKPKELESLYSELVPADTQEHIKERDKA